jgi:galactose mutarotase-like enzyme
MVGHGSRLRSSLMIQQHITTTRASQDERASPSVAGGGRWISVDLLAGYRYAQVLAPKGKDYIALESMSAPTSALRSGRGLRLAEPGGKFLAAFRTRIDAARRS